MGWVSIDININPDDRAVKRVVDSANLLIDIDINNAGQPPYGTASGLSNRYSLKTNAEQWNIFPHKKVVQNVELCNVFQNHRNRNK